MSIGIMSKIFKAQFKDIDGVSASTLAFVALALADHANDEGMSSYPSYRRICEKTKLSENTVIRAIKALEGIGVITKDVGASPRGTNNYELSIEKIEELCLPRGDRASPVVGDALPRGDRPASPVAGDESSFKHTLTTHTKVDVKDTIKHSDKVFEGLLAFQKIAEDNKEKSWYGRERIPERLLPLLDHFVNISKLTPHRNSLIDWTETANEWLELNLTEDDISKAFEHSRGNSSFGGFIVSRPGSLTKVALAKKAERALSEEGGGVLSALKKLPRG